MTIIMTITYTMGKLNWPILPCAETFGEKVLEIEKGVHFGPKLHRMTGLYFIY